MPQSAKEPSPKKVPDSIHFGNDVLIVPTFSAAGISSALSYLPICEPEVRIGDWVDRGDKLLTATVYVFRKDAKPRWPFSSDDSNSVTFVLKSPTSGIVLGHHEDYVGYSGMAIATSNGLPITYGSKSVFPVLLLPTDEPPQNSYELSFFRELNSTLVARWEKILFSHGELGYVRLRDAMQTFSEERQKEIHEVVRESKPRDAKVERFETRPINASDSDLLRNVQNLRSYDLEMRQKLVHLVSSK